MCFALGSVGNQQNSGWEMQAPSIASATAVCFFYSRPKAFNVTTAVCNLSDKTRHEEAKSDKTHEEAKAEASEMQ